MKISDSTVSLLQQIFVFVIAMLGTHWATTLNRTETCRQIDRLDQRILALESESKSKDESIRMLESQADRLTSEYALQRDRINVLVAERHCTTRIVILEEDIRKHCNELCDCKDDLDRSKRELEILREENSTLRRKIAQLESEEGSNLHRIIGIRESHSSNPRSLMLGLKRTALQAQSLNSEDDSSASPSPANQCG